MSVLKIKNGQGNWVTIPTIKGERGHSPEVTATKTNGVTTISVDGTSIATINDGEDATLDVSADEYSASATYAVGDYCAYDGGLYKCTTDIETAEAWNQNHWTQITITDEIQTLKQDLSLKVDDVQIDGTSIVTDGVAEIPTATSNIFGVMKIGAGLTLNGDKVATSPASSAYIKSGSASNLPLVPYRQHESTFYGLAKAAGDATQSASSNAVGTYTDEAKRKITAMIEPQFRLIKEIEITEETGNIYVNSDSLNNPFSLTEMIFEFKGIVGSDNGHGAITPNNGTTPGYLSNVDSACLAIPNIYNTTAQTRTAHICVKGGKFFGECSYQSFTAIYAAAYDMTSKNATGIKDCDAITEFYISSLNSFKFTSGTITVYGR